MLETRSWSKMYFQSKYQVALGLEWIPSLKELEAPCCKPWFSRCLQGGELWRCSITALGAVVISQGILNQGMKIVRDDHRVWFKLKFSAVSVGAQQV